MPQRLEIGCEITPDSCINRARALQKEMVVDAFCAIESPCDRNKKQDI